MKIRFTAFLMVCCVVLSATAASASSTTVNMKLATMGGYGWSTYADVDSSGRGSVQEMPWNYASVPDCWMFTNGRVSRTTGGNPWAVMTTTNYNGTKLSEFTALSARICGFEGYPSADQAWQPPHFVLHSMTPIGNNRQVEWVPWSDGTPRDPGVGGIGADSHWNTYNAMVDGSWFCNWTSQTFSTWADLCAATLSDGSGTWGDCTLTMADGAYGAAWKGQPFSFGYARYASGAVESYNNAARGCVDWFTVGVNGADTTFYLGVPEPSSILALAGGLLGLIGIYRRRS